MDFFPPSLSVRWVKQSANTNQRKSADSEDSAHIVVNSILISILVDRIGHETFFS